MIKFDLNFKGLSTPPYILSCEARGLRELELDNRFAVSLRP